MAMVVHDDQNTTSDGQLQSGNFKVLSWSAWLGMTLPEANPFTS
jgi:hypothetical protein